MKLYELTAECEELRAWLAENPDADTAEVDARLAQLHDDANEKIENIGILAQEARREAEMFKAEEDRLRARRQTAENRRERLLAYLAAEMPRLGVKKVAGRVSVSMRRGQPSVGAVNINLLGSEWLEPQPPRVKKREIIARMKATGEIPEGVEIVTGPDCVVIR